MLGAKVIVSPLLPTLVLSNEHLETQEVISEAPQVISNNHDYTVNVNIPNT